MASHEEKVQRRWEKVQRAIAKGEQAYQAYTVKVAARMSAHLQPGEPVVAAIGVVRTGRNRGGDGITELARIPFNYRRGLQAKRAAEAVGFPESRAMVLTATDRRVMVFAQSVGSHASGRGVEGNAMPATLLGDVGYDRIERVEGREPTGQYGSYRTSGHVGFVLSGGGVHVVTAWGLQPERFAALTNGAIAQFRTDAHGDDLETDIDLDDSSAARGCGVSVSVATRVPCPGCRSDGCAACVGSGRTLTDRTYMVNVPPGVQNGTVLRLGGRGSMAATSDQTGDLYVHVRVSAMAAAGARASAAPAENWDPFASAPGNIELPPAAWMPDPCGRYSDRYWDGYAWTEHVRRDGAMMVDPHGV